MNFLDYMVNNSQQIYNLFIEHIELTILSVVLAIIIGVPIGVLVSHFSKINKPIMAVANIVQAIPSMALLGFLIPFLGIGILPSVFMVVIYSLLPIIKNTFTSISGINPQMVEAAEGIGMTRMQILFKIQIPMALPVIMAGIRISAVTAVGLMTIAAFIGAGGLGFLVFSGIRTANNYQILAGAIPACILALLIDFAASIIEKAVVPYGLNLKNKKSSKKERIFHKAIIIITIAIIGFTFFNATKDALRSKKNIVTIASKDYTEQEILGHMLGELIQEKTDLKVEKKLALGGTQVIFGAINKGEIDMYMDYTGTIYSDILKYDPIKNKVKANEIFPVCKKEIEEKYNLFIGNELPFNNTYALGIREEMAKKYNINSISDLIPLSKELVLSPTLEFINREDGLIGLKDKYKGLNFKKTLGIDGSPRYIALKHKKTDVTDVWVTDALIKEFDIRVLKDDKEFFLPYHAVLVVRKELVEKYPELKEITKDLEKLLTDKVMGGLNHQVDILKRKPNEVAHEFLVKNNLIKK